MNVRVFCLPCPETYWSAFLPPEKKGDFHIILRMNGTENLPSLWYMTMPGISNRLAKTSVVRLGAFVVMGESS